MANYKTSWYGGMGASAEMPFKHTPESLTRDFLLGHTLGTEHAIDPFYRDRDRRSGVSGYEEAVHGQALRSLAAAIPRKFIRVIRDIEYSDRRERVRYSTVVAHPDDIKALVEAAYQVGRDRAPMPVKPRVTQKTTDGKLEVTIEYAEK